MGIHKQQRLEKQDQRRAKNERRRKRHIDPADWASVDPEVIVGFVELAQRLDGAVRFGRSRDGAVFAIGFYLGDDRFTEWIKPDSDRDDEFARIHDEICEDFEVSSPFSGEDVSDS